MSLIVTCSCGQKNRVADANAEVRCGKCRQPLDTWQAAMQAAQAAQPSAPPPSAGERRLLETIVEVVKNFDPDGDARDALEEIADLLSDAGFDVSMEDEDDDEDDDE